jgi:aspartate/methionine/tyrosine aminotransferase
MEQEQSLTRHEWSALTNRHNLADGHARQGQSSREEGIVSSLADLYAYAEGADQIEVQHAFEDAFYRRAGQPSILQRALRPLHNYSASLAIEVVANYLRRERLTVALLHPTFDNLATILLRHDVRLDGLSEEIFGDPGNDAFYEGHDAIFLVLPNNPTGYDPEPETVRRIAEECKARDLLLIIDFTFRFYSGQLLGWDQYEYFESIGLRYIGIEDTGKTWPTLDLKIGSLIASDESRPDLELITDDCILNVSPFVFVLLKEYIEADDDLQCTQIARRNREVLCEELAGRAVEVIPSQSAMSVAWVGLPAPWRSSEACGWLSDNGVSVLPGGPFFWATSSMGENRLRVALMRPLDEFASAATALAHALKRYEDERGVGE